MSFSPFFRIAALRDLRDEFAIQTVIDTATLALWALGAKGDIAQADRFAVQIWEERHPEKGQSA